MTVLLLVALAGALGAAARYLVDHALTSRAPRRLPWGTFVVNVSGSFLAGLVVGLALRHGLPEAVSTVLLVGFLGAYSTFSTWMYQVVQLIEEGAWRPALAYLLGSMVAGPVAAGAALQVLAVICAA